MPVVQVHSSYLKLKCLLIKSLIVSSIWTVFFWVNSFSIDCYVLISIYNIRFSLTNYFCLLLNVQFYRSFSAFLTFFLIKFFFPQRLKALFVQYTRQCFEMPENLNFALRVHFSSFFLSSSTCFVANCYHNYYILNMSHQSVTIFIAIDM